MADEKESEKEETQESFEESRNLILELLQEIPESIIPTINILLESFKTYKKDVEISAALDIKEKTSSQDFVFPHQDEVASKRKDSNTDNQSHFARDIPLNSPPSLALDFPPLIESTPIPPKPALPQKKTAQVPLNEQYIIEKQEKYKKRYNDYLTKFYLAKERSQLNFVKLKD